MAFRSKIVLFGDSITQQSFAVGGWGSRLANLFERKADVFNRGYSGFTTLTAKPLLPFIFPSNPNENLLATIFFGANDGCFPGGEFPQHVPLAEYAQNLKELITHIKKSTKHIIVIAPPPVDHERWQNRNNDTVQQYAATAAEVARSEGVGFVDTYNEMIATNWMSFLNDGLHLSGEGNEFLYNMIVKQLPVSAESLPYDFPIWKDMSLTDPFASVQPASIAKLPYACWSPQ